MTQYITYPSSVKCEEDKQYRISNNTKSILKINNLDKFEIERSFVPVEIFTLKPEPKQLSIEVSLEEHVEALHLNDEDVKGLISDLLYSYGQQITEENINYVKEIVDAWIKKESQNRKQKLPNDIKKLLTKLYIKIAHETLYV